ncbi:hypothetical protein [Geothrix edaphica]|uniref:Uncharacterized protein n=1 Tax=Geothrix edaphica TaxID=2927976 RepID=A0ABQ5PY03_9BACT|nr:hypothetical protein [Geothrix edaphica]GLH67005.1 hypothetical protein GETHED_13690 [Geothrix edaphica]
MQPPRSILRSQALASRAIPMNESPKAHPLLRTTPTPEERWASLQRRTQEMISYFVATLRRTW